MTFVATAQSRGGSPGQGAEPEAHVAFGMGTLEWELWNGNSSSHCCFPGTRFQFPGTKPLGFHDGDDVIAWTIPWLAVIAIPTTLLARWARGWGDLGLCIFLTVLQRCLRDKDLAIPEFRFLLWHCLVV